jgi:hypothetical protein
VLFPHARQRLWLDDRHRISLLASRFVPDACLGMDHGAWLVEQGGRWVNAGPPESAFQIGSDGSLEPVEGREIQGLATP